MAAPAAAPAAAAPPPAPAPQKDTLEKTVVFLQKREGIDKVRAEGPAAPPPRPQWGRPLERSCPACQRRATSAAAFLVPHKTRPCAAPLTCPARSVLKALKIIRYTSRLIAAVSPEGSEARRRFDLLQANVGQSRRGLGRFGAAPAPLPPACPTWVVCGRRR